MKSKRIISLLLSIVMIFSMFGMPIYADTDDATTATVTVTAQADGAFLCAPQINISVSSDTAENYGFTDSVTGVSVADALVKLHEVKYGSSFTEETAGNYLAYSDAGYISKLFGTETYANGFVLNGAYPNDGTESSYGGYNGTTVSTQEITDGDTVEFLIYQDQTNWSDELAWFNYKGNAVTEIVAAPGTNAKLKLQSYTYMYASSYKDADAIHAVGSSVAGAQLALVKADGTLYDVSGAVTDANGDVTVTAPAAEGTYYLTAYIPSGTEGEPLIMSLTKIVVDKNAPTTNPWDLTSLSVTDLANNPNALELVPAFNSSTTSYSVPIVVYDSVGIVYIKAAAEDSDAVITAECNGKTATITSGDSTWKSLVFALSAGKNNELKITVEAQSQTKVYTVTVPMKPETNTAPTASVQSETASVMLGNDYSVDLSEKFTDADEIDTLTYKVSVNGEEAVTVDADYIFTPDTDGEYTLVFTANDGTADSDTYTVKLTVTPAVPAPTSLTVAHDSENVIDGVVIVKKGDKFKVVAYDENGNATPYVTWKNTFYNSAYQFDSATGTVEVVGDVYTSTDMLYFTATSTIDESVSSAQTRIQVSGIAISNKTQTVALSTDGQTAKTASLTAGRSGHNIWSYTIPEGVAELAADPGSSNSIKFNVFRPGVIDVSFKLDISDELTDSATITVTGVAVEDNEGSSGKTYLDVSADNPSPTVQLSAYVAEGKTVEGWSSADETVATVDENGLVTAKGIGSVIITAEDSDGTKGGIKVVVQSAETPYFENLQFLSTAIKDYSTAYVFAPTTTEYDLTIKTYSTTKLTLQNTTLYDSDKYSAVAKYTDINGEKQSVSVNSGAITYLEGIPFGTSTVIITLSDKNNADSKTVYTLNVTRPRDTTKTIKSSGIVLAPDGRSLLTTTKYNGYAEGTMFRLTDGGEISSSTGVTATYYNYKCFVFSDVEEFTLTLTGTTVYEHLRYSTDGLNWTELPQGGGVTDKLSFAEDENLVTVKIQIIDDTTYAENLEAQKEGFADCEPKEYTVTIEKADDSTADAQILTATATDGEWYPCTFNKDKFSYTIVVPKDVTEKTLTYTVSDGATVKIGTAEQTAVDGTYTLALTTTQKTLTVTSADGKVVNTYYFKLQKKSDGYPDKVVDFLCINSQYTNGIGYGNAATPWISLNGAYTSIGDFGGYITYYYAAALTNNPNNKYGIDFYVYGNASKDTTTSTKTSFFEPAQAWVSEDGETWYALAGSAHYDEGVDWDYSVTYSRTASGKTSWVDSYGNSNDGTSYSGQYPLSSVYCMNSLVNFDSITLSGIVLPAANGDIAPTGLAVNAYSVRWGYADAFANGTKGADVNPYTDNTNFDLQTNGFDLEWAVDKDGNPVDVSGKEFHYVKLVTASHIWHPSFGEKSAEIAGVVRTTAQNEAVGKTDAPTGVTITDGAQTKVVNFNETAQIYSVDIGDMKYVSISVNGAAEDDNIYVNNERIAYDGAADGFKVTKEGGTKLVRVIVQNGDKEPQIYLLKITGSATESDDLIEGVKIYVDGSTRVCSTKDGIVYTATVGYRISSVGIFPVADSDVEVTVNGEALEDKYELSTGENTFTITGEKDGVTHTVTLKITKSAAPTTTGKITVYFTLLGDEEHGESDEVHTLKYGGLETWISKTAIEVDAPATVLDVLEKALDGEYSFINADGNYISEINGLAEFDNGTLSGWMYTLNGDYPNSGVAEQTVKNGDKIVFHYTDDYTQERASEQWTSSSTETTYTVKFETNGGSTVKSQSIAKNGTVTAPEAPVKDGYTFVGWYTDKALTAEYDFTAKVTKGFTLYAKWEEKAETNELAFTDVDKDAWYYDYVQYVYEKGLMQGADGKFDPDGNMTRAMLVTVLYRLDGADAPAKASGFTDVADGEWYADAIAWAAENGIVVGISETEFAPNENITREQLAAVFYRYAKFKGYDTSDAADLNVYEDADEISEYAIDAFAWSVAKELIRGVDATTISSKTTSTRAQVATILMRFCENIK